MPHVPLNAPRATTFTAELAALELDAASLPKFAELSPKQIRGVMQLFRKSLGARCNDCHVPEGFDAPTRRKAIAQHMWDQITVPLATTDGSPLFCDSCHQGHLTPLIDRSDLVLLKGEMKASFVDKLVRKDAQVHGCTTCHVSDSDFALFDRWSTSN